MVNHHIENIVQLTSNSQINQLIQLGTIDNHDDFFIDIDLKQSHTG
ncbi:DNA-binding response regulator, partial [Enterococcus faecium]